MNILVAMSGGVDSSVAAVLLQRAGYEVVGVTCLFHDDEVSRGDAAAAEEVCRALGIDHAVADCTAQFAARVVEPFVESAATPPASCRRSSKSRTNWNAARSPPATTRALRSFPPTGASS